MHAFGGEFGYRLFYGFALEGHANTMPRRERFDERDKDRAGEGLHLKAKSCATAGRAARKVTLPLSFRGESLILRQPIIIQWILEFRHPIRRRPPRPGRQFSCREAGWKAAWPY